MTICSLGFLLFCGGVAIVFQLAPVRRLRQAILACASAGFFASLIPDSRSWIWFVIALAATYAALILVRARPRGAVVAFAITVVSLLYVYLKRFTLLADFIPIRGDWDLRLHPVELIGLSYMIFKFVHMLVDQWQEQLAPFNLWTYLNYQLSFFTLTAGPIQRYNDFLRYWEEMDLAPSTTRESLRYCIRLLTGMIKIGVVGAYAYSAFQAALHVRTVTLRDALVCFYVYPVYLYFNFSGYTDVVLGAGGLLGFRLPENFNRPWLARNVLDFWDRWHITLSHWIRDYVFMASYKVAATRFPEVARYSSYALLFFALLAAGIWHGATDGFVAFGLLNGLGAAATRAYGDVLRTTLGRRRLHAYLHSPTVRVIAIVVTLHYVCLCQLFFSSDLLLAVRTLEAAGREALLLPAMFWWYSWQGPLLATCLTGGLLLALWKADAIESMRQRLARQIADSTRWLWAVLCLQCMFVTGMFFVAWALQEHATPILYMAF